MVDRQTDTGYMVGVGQNNLRGENVLWSVDFSRYGGALDFHGTRKLALLGPLARTSSRVFDLVPASRSFPFCLTG